MGRGMIVVIGGQKGGTGKSTLAENLAVVLAHAGKKTLLVDTDVQASATKWSDTRSQFPALPSFTTVQKTGKIAPTLEKMRADYDEILVDAGGRDSIELRSALLVADRLVIPVRPSQKDLWTVDPIAEVVEAASALNERLAAALLLTMVPTNPAVRELQNARELLVDIPGMGVCQSVIHDRKAYRDVVFLGKGVIEHHDPKAAAEIRTLATEIYPHVIALQSAATVNAA